MLSYRTIVRVLAAALFLALTAGPAAAQRSDFGTLTIQVRPPEAEIFVDGERWVSPQESGPLVIQLLPGVHRVELRAPGRRPYASEVTIRAGENVPLNVALPQGGPANEPVGRTQPPPPPPPSAPGPIVQTASAQDGFVFAPDVRITEIAHETSTLVGAYGGWVFAGQFLVGAGGYWQANDTLGTRMTYAGPVLEWRMFPTSTVGLNLHGLVGGGYVYADYGHSYYPPYGPYPNPTDGHHGAYPYPYYHDNVFFVAEPEAQVVFRFGALVRVQAGAGYRATSAHGLSGASGSISVQFGR
jgi:hypothetical protein